MGYSLKNKFWKNDGLEIALLDCRNHHFPKHYHDEYVIGVNVEGGENIWVDGKTYDADLSDITLYNPGEVQASGPVEENWKFISIYFDQDYLQSLFGEDERIIFDRSVLRSSLMANSFRRGAIECLRATHSKQEVHEYIMMLCDGLLRQCSKTEPTAYSEDCIVKEICEFLMDDLENVLSIGEIAKFYSMTPVQLVRIFKKSMKIPPYQWQKIQKLRKIKDELETHGSLLELSFKYGFSDQAHMSRQFKQVFGFTPGYYRQELK